MADEAATLNEISARNLKLKLVDNGDGTYSLAVDASVGGGGGLTNAELRATPVPVEDTAVETAVDGLEAAMTVANASLDAMEAGITYATVTTGEWAPGVAAAQAPTVVGKLVRLKARLANTGSVFIGNDSSVIVADGTTDTNAGLELAPGDDSGWIPVANLNVFYGIGAGASDSVTYMVLAA